MTISLPAYNLTISEMLKIQAFMVSTHTSPKSAAGSNVNVTKTKWYGFERSGKAPTRQPYALWRPTRDTFAPSYAYEPILRSGADSPFPNFLGNRNSLKAKPNNVNTAPQMASGVIVSPR